MRWSRPRGGPAAAHAPTSRPGAGFTSPAAIGYRFTVTGAQSLTREARGLIGTRVEAGRELVYAVLPEWVDADPGRGFAADAVAVDLVFTDGTRLTQADPVDQYGVPVDALSQHRSRRLHPDQWNLVRVRLDAVIGREISDIELVFADTRAGAGPAVSGWIDALAVAVVADLPRRPSEWARTRQGTMSSAALSRGGCAPTVAVPNGFVGGIPVTRARERGWPYAWHAHNRADNRPAIEAFATSHLPSPWMGERAAFQIMPAARRVPATPAQGALGFTHDGESAWPHLYRVELDGGIRAEMTATDHTVLVRVRFAAGAREGMLVFDQIEGSGGLALPRPDPTTNGSSVTAWTDDGLGARADRAAAGRAFLHAHIDRPVVAAGRSRGRGAGPARGWVRVALGEDGAVVVRMATSFIGTEQAQRNLALDGADADFDEVSARAAAAWDDWIGRIAVDGASSEQRAVMATSLYRVGLFPRRAHENLGTADEPRPHFASPFHPMGTATPERTGAQIVAGELSVDQGFWDVYRTAWPLYALLDPARAARLLDGFAEHYRAGGWTSRWSAPGPIDSMTGTSNDIVFAHAVEAGVPVRTHAVTSPDDHRLDLWAAYESALRNASVPSGDVRVGRKGLARSTYRGWVSTDVPEGLSWTLDGSINDLAVARLASALLRHVEPAHPRSAELRASVRYFTARAGGYAHAFDPGVGFFQGRDADGRFRLPPEDYDPRVWGHDYTETNGWGTAFSAPHDGAGLAALHGGRDALAATLEEFLRTPEEGVDRFRGSYPHVIHEMTEARNLRFGQWAPSNQPAHHIPFMALFAGRPDLTQRLVHDAASRLFTGGEIGQGWPGDEDNGEMSAWWVFAALGLYPLVPGTAGYALTAPLFRRVRIAQPGGSPIVIAAPAAGPEHPYIRGVRIDGEAWTSTFVPHERLRGGAVIEFDLAPTPQPWGAAPDAEPPSLSASGAPALLHDLTAAARVSASNGADARAAFDDDASSGAVRLRAGDRLVVELADRRSVDFLTLTPARAGRVAFRVEAGGVTQRWDAAFVWDGQLRPFEVALPTATEWIFVAETDVDVAQLELLVRTGLEL